MFQFQDWLLFFYCNVFDLELDVDRKGLDIEMISNCFMINAIFGAPKKIPTKFWSRHRHPGVSCDGTFPPSWSVSHLLGPLSVARWHTEEFHIPFKGANKWGRFRKKKSRIITQLVGVFNGRFVGTNQEQRSKSWNFCTILAGVWLVTQTPVNTQIFCKKQPELMKQGPNSSKFWSLDPPWSSNGAPTLVFVCQDGVDFWWHRAATLGFGLGCVHGCGESLQFLGDPRRSHVYMWNKSPWK